jgi:D-xylulose kinase
MSRDLFLGLDVGTQGTKGLLVDVEARAIVARASAPYGLLEGLPPGAAEQHPSTWIDAVGSVARRLLAGVDPGRVRGVGVSGQQHGLVLLDARGDVLRPAKLWCDTSTAAEAEELSRRFGARVPVGYTASKVLWTARNEPELWSHARAAMLPHDYIDFRLTGERVAEAGDASGTGYFDPAARSYDLERAAAIDERLPAMLPPLVEPGALAGRLSAEGARLLGLPSGVPVAAGSGDNMCAAVGAGATRAGIAVLSLGTSATVFGRSTSPVVDPEGLVAPFCDATGGWLPLLCVMNATGVTEEVRRATGLDHGALAERAAEVEPGARGVLWLPYLVGERVPDLPRATGAILGLRPGSLDAGVLYRAAVEGVALNLAEGVERMRTLGLSVERVRAVGGASRNRLWLRVLADVLGLPVAPLAEPEAAALGAALLAADAAARARGEVFDLDRAASALVAFEGDAVEPDSLAAETYREARARFRAGRDALFER